MKKTVLVLLSSLTIAASSLLAVTPASASWGGNWGNNWNNNRGFHNDGDHDRDDRRFNNFHQFNGGDDHRGFGNFHGNWGRW